MKRTVIGPVAILFCLTICLILGAALHFTSAHNYWDNFERDLISKYSNVGAVEIEGAGSYEIILIRVSKQADLEDIERLFYEVINQPVEVFEDLEEIHNKMHGDLTNLSICFYTDSMNRSSAYTFEAYIEEGEYSGFAKFKKWTMEHNGITKLYTIPQNSI